MEPTDKPEITEEARAYLRRIAGSGGRKRAQNMSEQEREDSARYAAVVRWGRKRKARKGKKI